MKNLLLAAAAATAMLAGAGTAGAATTITLTPPAGDGSRSADFVDTGPIAVGLFHDHFDFDWGAAGITAGSITATVTAVANDIDFSSIVLDGHAFTKVIGGPGLTEFWQLTVPVSTPGGNLALDVFGSAAGTAGTYAGHLSFTPNAVPEPETWALMILGFGGAGAMLRSRRKLQAAVA